MRTNRPVLLCDGDDGDCDTWDIDHYEESASMVGVTRITATVRAPGWTSTDDSDLCPDHQPKETDDD